MRSFGYRRRRLLLTGAAVKLVEESLQCANPCTLCKVRYPDILRPVPGTSLLLPCRTPHVALVSVPGRAVV